MYGLSGQELQKALSDGRVSSEAFEQAIVRLTDKGGKYANGAIAQSDTLNGRLSTLRDTVTSLSQTIGGVLEPALSRILLIATNTVDTINRAMRAALLGPQNADTIAQVNAGQLPFGTAGVDKLIGEQRRKALQGQSAGFLGMMDQGKFLKLLQQQPEFRSPAGTGGRVAPLTVPALTGGTRAAGGGGQSAGAKSQSPAAQIATALKSALGLTDAQAAGIVGNLMRESGLNPRVNEGGAVGLPRGVGGYGLAQWTGSRQTDLVRFAGGRGQAGDMATQLRFLVSEMMGPEAASLARLKTAQSPEQAAYLFDKHYERSGIKAMGERQGNARRVFGELAGGGPSAGLGDYARQLQDQARADAKLKEDAKRKAEEDAKGLSAARETLYTKQALLKIAEATNPMAKLEAEFEKEKADRMRDYAAKLAGATTEQARQAEVASQILDIRLAERNYQQQFIDLTAQQLTQERERADLLAESMARMEELNSRSSAGAGFQQGIQGYVDSVGNLRDAVGQLTTNSIGGLEDSLVELATTGTTNFKAFAASVLADTSRMIIRQLVLKTIMQIIGGIGGGVGSGFEMPGQAFIPSGGYSFAGGGYTGNGARSGGLDGQGGFMAMLHPRETVIDHTRGTPRTSSASSNNITINVDAGGTKASGDPGTGAALARDLARVVDDRLIHHRRPGGLLAA
jgi:lambda family phage tail tape measure protein